MLSEEQLSRHEKAANLQAGASHEEIKAAREAIQALAADAREARAKIQEAKRRMVIFEAAMKYSTKLTPFRQERIRKTLAKEL